MTPLIYDKRKFELSTSDAIMNIAVSLLCVLLKTCLICLFTELSHFISFLKHFSAS